MNNTFKMINIRKKTFVIVMLFVWALFLNNISIANAVNIRKNETHIKDASNKREHFESNITNYMKQLYSMANTDPEKIIEYPINAIFITTDATDPNTYLEGTWVRFGAGNCLVGKDTSDADFKTLETTKGAKKLSLTTSNLPKHNHEWGAEMVETEEAGEHQHTWAMQKMYLGTKKTSGSYSYERAYSPSTTTERDYIDTTKSGLHSHGISTGGWAGTFNKTGSGQAIKLVQPYVVVYMWKRTA